MTSQQTFTCSKSTRETLEFDVVLMSLFLKLVSAIFYQTFIFSSNDRPSKIMKNVFYFL